MCTYMCMCVCVCVCARARARARACARACACGISRLLLSRRPRLWSHSMTTGCRPWRVGDWRQRRKPRWQGKGWGKREAGRCSSIRRHQFLPLRRREPAFIPSATAFTCDSPEGGRWDPHRGGQFADARSGERPYKGSMRDPKRERAGRSSRSDPQVPARPFHSPFSLGLDVTALPSQYSPYFSQSILLNLQVSNHVSSQWC